MTEPIIGSAIKVNCGSLYAVSGNALLWLMGLGFGSLGLVPSALFPMASARDTDIVHTVCAISGFKSQLHIAPNWSRKHYRALKKLQ